MREKRKSLRIIQIIAIAAVVVLAAAALAGCAPKADDNDSLLDSVALELAKEKYEKVFRYYWMGGDSYDTITPNENDNWYERIDNYEEITDTLTKKYLQEFTAYRPIVEENGKYYMRIIARGGNIYYCGADGFEVKSITDGRMEFTVKEKYHAEELGKDPSEITEFEYKYNSFVLVKEDGKWKVDEFTLPC